MTAGVDKPTRFWNSSTGENKGIAGKLNADQIKERCKLHAERLAFGKPTIQHIVDHWWHKHQIRMSYSAEKEWAWRNESSIVEVMNNMADTGEIKLAISDQSLLNTVNISGVETARVVKLLENKFTRMMQLLDLDFDPWGKVGVKRQEYLGMTKEEQVEVEFELKRLENQQKMIIRFLPELSAMIKDHKRVLLDSVTTTKDIFDDSKFKRIAMQKEISKQIGTKLKEQSDKSGFDPLEVEVTDMDRKALEERESR